MDISKAALPARYGRATEADRAHPMFSLYERYRSAMSQLLVDSPDFRDWLACHEAQRDRDAAAEHPMYPQFLSWMRAEQGGARVCPAGAFPQNFEYWLKGGRW